ncbi:hypothetical protein C356_00426 [Cryptococcus neoformans c45]|nr:hypothetical protein C356_00426 [Cryptococcus neoformans var. grubii c45]
MHLSRNRQLLRTAFTAPRSKKPINKPILPSYIMSQEAGYSSLTEQVTSAAAAASRTVSDLVNKHTVHDIAKTGFGEGTNDFYNAARPSYPADALRVIHSSLPSHPLKIVEPGSGTGIFSRLLLAPPNPTYPSFSIDTLVAVEPSEGMRNSWWKALEKAGLGKREENEGGKGEKKVGTVDGGFDSLGAVGEYGVTKVQNGLGGVDGVIIAQAWHWCPDYEKALREIATYLRPNAPLILIWNLEANDPQWQADLREAYQGYDLGSPQYYKGLWRKMFETPAYKELFGPSEEHTIPWSVGITESGVLDRLFSKSYLTEQHLNGERREEFIDKVKGIVSQAPHEWIDKEKGTFKYNYNTDIVICRRKA